MRNFNRYLAVGLIALFAGLVAACDAIVVSIYVEDFIHAWVIGATIIVLFLLVVSGVFVLSTTTGTIRGDSARAFMSLAIVGCLTPVVMVILKLLDSGDSPQQDQLDAGFNLVIIGSLIVGGIVAGIGYAGYQSLRNENQTGISPTP